VSRFIFIVGLLVFIVIAAFGIAFVLRLLSPVVDAAGPITSLSGGAAREAVESYFRISFPPAPATDDFYIARRNDDYWIRFNAAKDELRGLLAGSPVLVCDDLALLDGLRPEFAFRDLTPGEQRSLDWWTPDAVASFVGSDCVGEDLTSYKILVDTARTDIWTVYLEITKPAAS
jgi:hypothetical protein